MVTRRSEEREDTIGYCNVFYICPPGQREQPRPIGGRRTDRKYIHNRSDRTRDGSDHRSPFTSMLISKIGMKVRVMYTISGGLRCRPSVILISALRHISISYIAHSEFAIAGALESSRRESAFYITNHSQSRANARPHPLWCCAEAGRATHQLLRLPPPLLAQLIACKLHPYRRLRDSGRHHWIDCLSRRRALGHAALPSS